MMTAHGIETLVELANGDHQEAARLLKKALDDPATTAEAALAAEEKLAEYAQDAVEWFYPTGFRILVYIAYLPLKMEGGILMTEESRAAYQSASIYGRVLAVGPLAYLDPVRFPKGAWCHVGDVVMFRAYAGTRFERIGFPFTYTLINDDSVEGVIADGVKVERPRQ